MRAPETVIRTVEAVLSRNGVGTNTITGFGPSHTCRVLLLGELYIVAEGFRFELVEINK